MVTLELTEDDLYANGTIIEYDDGTMVLERPITSYTPQIGDSYYEVQQGDEWDILAYLQYTNSKLWHLLANSNNVINPFDPLPDTIVLPNTNTSSFQ